MNNNSPLEIALADFVDVPLRQGALRVLDSLGYSSGKTEELPSPDAEGFAQAFGHTFSKAAQQSEWKRIELLFQITDDELNGQMSLAGELERRRYDSFLFFAVQLTKESYSRTDLANMAREINKPFPAPVIVLFRHGQTMSLASLHRRENKVHSHRDVLDRVVLLKDIRLEDPHAAHKRILLELAKAKNDAKNWKSFLDEWNRVLDLSELNKRFYRELSTWFFAAQQFATFPDKGENATERGLIRLITRLIFTWFIKERGLVPDALFDPSHIKALLKKNDGDSDTYYRAVLQNLFFATLNREMNERDFTPQNGGPRKQQGEYGNTTLWRYGDDFNDAQAWKELVAQVPFLNGGLFECLDHCSKEGEYIDGFSRETKRQAHLPNKLFWGDEFTADLSGVLDDKKQKAVKVKPLLNLLRSYKFTIDENTPLEEDVALDPELLGKVFENLLASYNPETRTTARKQTGSFYTPREIVGYMVEESLFAYLEPTVGDVKTPEDENVLRVLLSETDARTAHELKLSSTRIEALVDALQRCTILDPACGSGAFPMGALSKMVALLKKLDPQNNLWRAAQLKAVTEQLRAHSDEANARQEAKEATDRVFDDNDPDYTRKLFLIERCLFGVDIQPVALQISKLRFFIALIVDQTIIESKPNRNVRALPNLETKFVAANTLISLVAPEQGTLADAEAHKELDAKFLELDQVRRDHIAPKTRRIKKELESKDDRLRSEIKTLMTEARFGDSFITPIVEWNPYDQNAVAPFFEPERMFGPELKDGFDIVIGNPPYGADTKIYLKSILSVYPQAKKVPDSYCLFMAKGVDLLRPSGILSFIVPNTFCDLEKGDDFRRWIITEHTLKEIWQSGWAFDSAIVDTLVFFILKPPALKNATVAIGVDENKHQREMSEFLEAPLCKIDYRIESASKPFLQKVAMHSTQFCEVATVKAGVKMYEKGKGQPPQTEATMKERPYSKKGVCPKGWRRLYRGTEIGRFALRQPTEFVSYGAWLAAPRTQETFKSPKILMRRTDDRILAAIEEEDSICVNSCHVIKLKDVKAKRGDYLFVLGVLNSRITQFVFELQNPQMVGKVFAEIKVVYVERLPIPNATPAEQGAISSKVEAILAAKAADAGADVSNLEREIDELVAALYGLDEDEKKLVGIG